MKPGEQRPLIFGRKIAGFMKNSPNVGIISCYRPFEVRTVFYCCYLHLTSLMIKLINSPHIPSEQSVSKVVIEGVLSEF